MTMILTWEIERTLKYVFLGFWNCNQGAMLTLHNMVAKTYHPIINL